jgi:hypothetical protein
MWEKSSPQKYGLLLQFSKTSQSKQSPIGRNFFKSGHSGAIQGLSLGCQMVCFQTKNTNLGIFWRVLRWNVLEYYVAIWSILWPSSIHTYFTAFWYILR